jgi:hypothetical protein
MRSFVAMPEISTNCGRRNAIHPNVPLHSRLGRTSNSTEATCCLVVLSFSRDTTDHQFGDAWRTTTKGGNRMRRWLGLKHYAHLLRTGMLALFL